MVIFLHRGSDRKIDFFKMARTSHGHMHCDMQVSVVSGFIDIPQLLRIACNFENFSARLGLVGQLILDGLKSYSGSQGDRLLGVDRQSNVLSLAVLLQLGPCAFCKVNHDPVVAKRKVLQLDGKGSFLQGIGVGTIDH